MNIATGLKQLSELLTDSQLGFSEAAARTDHAYLKRALMDLGNGRAPLVEELGNELAKLGEETPVSGTMKGSLHRKWIDVRDSLSPSTDQDVIEECDLGEKHLLEQYEEFGIKTDPDPAIKNIIHQNKLRSDLEQIRSLKNIPEHEK